MSWPKVTESVFAKDPHFQSREYRGLTEQRKTEAEILSYKEKGHGAIELGLPGAIKRKRPGVLLKK